MLWNRPFSRWHHITATTVFPLYIYILKVISARFRRQKPKFAEESKPWRILVVVVKWCHRAMGLNIVLTWRHGRHMSAQNETAAMIVDRKTSSEDWILFAYRNFPLFQEIYIAADHVSENDLLAIKWFIVVSNYEISYLGELEKNQVNMYKSQVEYEFNSGLSFWYQAGLSHLDKWVKVTDNLPRITMIEL